MLESLKEKEFVASRLQLTIAIWRSPRLSGVTQKVIWACSLKHCRLYDCQGQVSFRDWHWRGRAYRLVGETEVHKLINGEILTFPTSESRSGRYNYDDWMIFARVGSDYSPKSSHAQVSSTAASLLTRFTHPSRGSQRSSIETPIQAKLLIYVVPIILQGLEQLQKDPTLETV